MVIERGPLFEGGLLYGDTLYNTVDGMGVGYFRGGLLFAIRIFVIRSSHSGTGNLTGIL